MRQSRERLTASFAMILVCLAAGHPAAAGQNSWTTLNSPGATFGATAIAVHPADANIIYAARRYQSGSSITAHIVRTSNGGTSWDMVFTTPSSPTSAIEVNDIVIDPMAPTTVYASASGTDGGGAAIYRSTNDGASWTLKNFGVIAAASGLAVDPANAGTVYARTSNGIYKSTNSGDSWALVDSGSTYSLAIDPANGNVIAGTATGVRRSTNGGSSWTDVSLGLTISALAFQDSTGIVYAAGRLEGGVFRSVDGGANWTNLGSRFIGPAYNTFYGPIGIASLVVGSGPQPPLMAAVATCGMYKSLDGGATFSDANAGLTVLSPDSHCYNSAAAHVAHSPAAPADFFADMFTPPLVSKYTLDASVLAPECLLSANPTTVGQGGSTVLAAYCSPAATSYAWSPNTGLSPSAPGGSVSPTQGTSTYTVQGVNANGSSGVQSVTVFAPGPRPVNLSSRAQVLTGNDVMIAGFVIGAGSGNKTVAIVATGPSLSQYGIANPLANPTLTLKRSADQAVIASNDNWQTAGNAAQLQAAGLAPSDPLEAAILVSLPPGAYTAIVQGTSGGTGVGVVGVYEVDAPAIPLINVSTRARVLTGDDVLIGGFVIDAIAPLTVAVVATGPSLASYGISNPLANPRLTLVRSSDQAIIASNDDWQTHPNAPQLQTAGFAPSNPLEAGIYITLDPGAYTAIVSGVGGGTGVAVIGVYKVN